MDTARTINNLSPEDFFRQLTEPLEASSLNGTRKQYVKIEKVRERVDNVCQPWNYTFEIIGQPQVISVKDSFTVSCVARLTIIDDQGNIVAVRQVAGGSDVSFLKDNPDRSSVELKSLVAAANTEAFKRAWQAFGVGLDEVQFNSGTGTRGNAAPYSRAEWYDVEFLSDFVKFKNNMITADVRMPDGTKRELVVMNKGINWLASQFKREPEEIINIMLSSYGSSHNVNMSVYGTLSEYNGKKQLLFEQIRGGK